jgi:serine/threonine protein phosphatase PrpC
MRNWNGGAFLWFQVVVVDTVKLPHLVHSCTMQVVEHELQSKSGKSLDECEDGFVVTPAFACVVDGATSPTGRRWTPSHLTGGQWAARILCRAVEEDLVEEMSPSDIVAALTESLHTAYQQESGALRIMQESPEERATASLVIFSARLRKVILVGDCQVALVDERGHIVSHHQPARYIDTVTSEARAMFWQAEQLSSQNSEVIGDPGRELIHPLLVRQRRFQNNKDAPTPYRYWAMDGFPIEAEGIHIVDVGDSVKEVILASDGYPALYPTLQETEWNLREIINEDPMMVGIRHKSTKGVLKGAESFDDRTYLRIRLLQ